ncbi:MAG TPA: DUF1254 domain-containing protein [Verrucomicrobiae bacterium]|jgi:hypothetical protein
MKTKLATLALGLLLSASLPPSAGAAPTADEVQALARDIYYYAYPIVLMDVTMRQVTAVSNSTSLYGLAPINQFAYFRTYPDADSKDIVRFNFDTLYSLAWLDLSQGPMILSVPDTGHRYYLVPTLDMWSDTFSSLGSRTTGTQAGNYAFVPPGWHGKLPAGIMRIEAPTSLIWMMGRIQTDGPSDYDNVHKVQDGLKLTPLARWGKNYTPPAAVPVDTKVDTTAPPLVQVSKMTGMDMFARLAELMKKYPPHPNDYPILCRMQAIGLVPGQSWDVNKLDTATMNAINIGAKEGAADTIATIKKMGAKVNGWSILSENVGTYGTSYRQRAAIALGGLGANLPEDAIYPTAFLDGEGQPLNSTNQYVLHFAKGQTPPADAFWSITMYDDQGFQVSNPINRFAIGDRDKLKFNHDGSLDIYIQAESPGTDKESNWLPAPKSGAMAPTMRIYAPRREALDGTWQPPAFTKVE